MYEWLKYGKRYHEHLSGFNVCFKVWLTFQIIIWIFSRVECNDLGLTNNSNSYNEDFNRVDDLDQIEKAAFCLMREILQKYLNNFCLSYKKIKHATTLCIDDILDNVARIETNSYAEALGQFF